MRVASQFLPIANGEGNHPQGGGGVMVPQSGAQSRLTRAPYPSTALRAVPLPISDGEEQ